MTRRRLIGKLVLTKIRAPLRVLDIGCGTGTFLFQFNRTCTSVGIDVSDRALGIASRKNRNASFLVADASALPFKQGYFDLAICSEVLEHLEKDAEAIAEISRILSRKGLACFTVPQNPKYWTNEDAFDGHRRRYNAIDFARMLRNHQLHIERLFSWGFPLAFVFRKYISTKMFNARLHGTLTLGKARAVTIVATFLTCIFRFDDLFSWLNLGIGMIAVARKPASWSEKMC